MEKDILYIVKIGGNIIDDPALLQGLLGQFAGIKEKKILVHGGGKLATRMAEAMHIPQQLVEGRRITDAETLKIVTMVYAGYINKNIVAQLQALRCNAIGICGADGNAILSKKRSGTAIDYGFAGDVQAVNTNLLQELLRSNDAIVMAPITHDGNGQLLNTNADTIAQELATALGAQYTTELIYSFEKAGVLQDVADEASVIPRITPATYTTLKNSGAIHSGMVPKLDNAFTALRAGVRRVVIGKGQQLRQLINGSSGTSIIHE
jgi:acetylglutamate kinase